MEPDRRLTAQGLERKQQLLDCAAELFAERATPTPGSSTSCAAGVAKGLFYWYFENKEALFKELAEEHPAAAAPHQGEAIDPAADPLTRIRQGVEASVHFMAEHAPFFALLEVENVATSPTSCAAGTDVHVTDVAALIRAGMADGTIRDEDPALLALGVVGAVGHFSHFHRTGRIAVPPDLAGLRRPVRRALARRRRRDRARPRLARVPALRHRPEQRG